MTVAPLSKKHLRNDDAGQRTKFNARKGHRSLIGYGGREDLPPPRSFRGWCAPFAPMLAFSQGRRDAPLPLRTFGATLAESGQLAPR